MIKISEKDYFYICKKPKTFIETTVENGDDSFSRRTFLKISLFNKCANKYNDFFYHRSTQSRFDVNPNASFQSKQIDFASKSGTQNSPFITKILQNY